MEHPVNKAIECNVSQCAHHCDLENYCSLSKIKIGTNNSGEHCTDCKSFIEK